MTKRAMPSSIKCVIFDCDGTLIDSEKLCCQALVNVFTSFGAELTLHESIEHFQGGKLADILSETNARVGLNISLDVLEPMYREQVSLLFQAELKPMNGARSLIQFLEKNQIEFCVASNGPKDKVQYSLSLTGLLDSFDGKIFSAFDTNSWKPEPDLIMYSAMSMGFLPSECLYVDDTKKGVQAGVDAGVKTIQLCNGMSATKVDLPSVTHIHHLGEIESWISDTHC
ncbi:MULTISPECIES: HAD-IA family hydrolase [Vibrio]|uniref:HAD-IA family hydrolase n=1 Tax=Vibrio cortegadensis TaxID=1328770 RepID=A0ABV4M9G1_9VIBR|nr:MULTISPECIES: HAD-IA family hydrolase [Vibrio]MDN3696263.1 HAD-IA family hydrolase [Vibrio cortegadensis]